MFVCQQWIPKRRRYRPSPFCRSWMASFQRRSRHGRHAPGQAASLERVRGSAPALADRPRAGRGDRRARLPRRDRGRHRQAGRRRQEHLLRQLRQQGGVLPRGLRPGRRGSDATRRRALSGSRRPSGPSRFAPGSTPSSPTRRASRPSHASSWSNRLRPDRRQLSATSARCAPSPPSSGSAGARCESGEHLPPTLEETIVGGIFWVVYQRIVIGRPEELEGLLAELVEFALTPYLGAAAARRVAEARDN